MKSSPPPIIWSIAGHDSSGGAGLGADQRAADALGVHLCPVVASITAQHSGGVAAVFPLSPHQLQAQLDALAGDMPPVVIKTGLLGDAALIEVVARCVDRLRQAHPGLVLVIDPVLGASAGGAAFSDDEVLAAYRRELLPRATLLTPNRAEARRLLNLPGGHDAPGDELPRLAGMLRQMGAQAVAITGGDAPEPGWAVDWIDTPQAQGWLCAPRVATSHHHGSGCTFASACAAAMALGHRTADAIVLAKMVTHGALLAGHAAGQGAGPVKAHAGGLGPLPWLGIGQALPWRITHGAQGQPLFLPFAPPADGLYGILPDGPWVAAAAEAGLRCLQLRHKASQGVEAHILAAAGACARHGATLFINDHWRQALNLLPAEPRPGLDPDQRAGLPPGLPPDLNLGLHLGQEDLLSLDAEGIARLLAARHRIQLGLSSHSQWELARAAGCGASLIACGPVQATTTKDMPWIPQGEDNLRWWVTHSPAPVVAIGGLLTADDLRRHAACGPAALCVVRALGQDPKDLARTVPPLRQGVQAGRDAAAADAGLAALPHPVL